MDTDNRNNMKYDIPCITRENDENVKVHTRDMIENINEADFVMLIAL